MKKYLLTALLTSLVMAGALAAVFFVLSGGQKKNMEVQQKVLMEELDLLTDKKTILDEGSVEELTSAGDAPNLLIFPAKSADIIYSTAHSQSVGDSLKKKKLKGEYDIEHALWALNPYGTNRLSLYLYFKTKAPCSLKYNVSVKDPGIPDFTRELYNENENGLTEEHEYQLIGLVPGMDNFITLSLYNEKRQVIKEKTFRIKMDVLDNTLPVKLTEIKGKSEELVSNGLFCLLGYDAKNKKVPAGIYMYDNSGIIRGCIPLVNYRTDRIEFLGTDMIYSYSQNQFARVSSKGQVVRTYDLKGYKLHHDFVSNGYGQLYILATDTRKKSIQDIILSLDLKTGKTSTLLDLENLLGGAKKKAKAPKDTGKLDWIHLNSITMAGSSNIIISSRELSSIIKVSDVTSQVPKVQYIISDPAPWEGLKASSLLLHKTGIDSTDQSAPTASPTASPKVASILETPKPEPEPFESQYGQHTVFYETNPSFAEGQYYLLLYNNNSQDSPARKDIKWSRRTDPEHSMFYRYFVDEAAGTYYLAESIKVPYSNIVGSAQNMDGHRIINSGVANIFGEYDRSGGLICQYKNPAESYTYRVLKYNFKQFLFK